MDWSSSWLCRSLRILEKTWLNVGENTVSKAPIGSITGQRRLRGVMGCQALSRVGSEKPPRRMQFFARSTKDSCHELLRAAARVVDSLCKTANAKGHLGQPSKPTELNTENYTFLGNIWGNCRRCELGSDWAQHVCINLLCLTKLKLPVRICGFSQLGNEIEPECFTPHIPNLRWPSSHKRVR